MGCLIISQNKEVYTRFIAEFEEYKILECMDFLEIKKHIKSEKYNAIIVDFSRLYNGKFLIEIINQINKRIPIVVIINTEQLEYEVEAEYLCVDIIFKYPLKGEEFQKRIEKLKLLIWYYEWKKKRKTKDVLKDG